MEANPVYAFVCLWLLTRCCQSIDGTIEIWQRAIKIDAVAVVGFHGWHRAKPRWAGRR
jgi:hypothetical protein